MSSAEFTDWRALDSLVPLDIDTRLMAQLLTVEVNINRDRKRHPQPFEVEDFLPVIGPLSRTERAALVAQAMGELQQSYLKRKAERTAAKAKAKLDAGYQVGRS